MAVKAAIAGLGRIASLLEEDRLREKPCTHAGAIAANPALVLCAGADMDEERRRLFAEKWGTPVYGDAETMLREQRPQILHIATHPDSHGRYCALAEQYGVSVVVCEKPLANTLWGARKIAALHNAGNITVITNHERRYAADYRRARDILLRGERLGPLCGVRGTLCAGKTRRLLDVLWHDGTHLADAAMFLTGALLKHRRSFGSGLRGRTGTAYLFGSLEAPSVPAASGSLPFLLELGSDRDHLIFELEFSCERGKLRIGNGIFEVWESRESPYAEKFKSLEKIEEGFTGKTGYFSSMVDDALSCALDKSHVPLSSATDGLRVIRYLHAIGAWR
ncbi:MAG: Gfo/Idh/MocA family oxidoreductase [Spirochaetaceae bacterium]|jgi:predicted dehydrogenase|nr:Gfo/Idh/MocA family oxidoreductase [Spirochaetaceae bacterium]